MGIDEEPFLQTIAEYNHAVQDGEYIPSIKDGKSTIGMSRRKRIGH